MVIITLEEMLRSGVHIGHTIKQWNPKMKKYIFAKRKNIYIIDILQTFICLEKVCYFLDCVRGNKKTWD